jgi:hypothetical protein
MMVCSFGDDCLSGLRDSATIDVIDGWEKNSLERIAPPMVPVAPVKRTFIMGVKLAELCLAFKKGCGVGKLYEFHVFNERSKELQIRP